MTFKRKHIGKSGEDLAATFLVEKGYKVLERNLKTKYGEIDILALDVDTVVIVEVKTKTNLMYDQPYEMVHYRKQQKLRNLAHWVAGERSLEKYRIDVISIDLSDSNPVIEHIMAAC